MLIGKVLSYDIYIVFIAYLKKGIHEIREFKVAPRYPIVIIRVNYKKYAHYHSISVSVLKLWGSLQEFKARMRLQ